MRQLTINNLATFCLGASVLGSGGGGGTEILSDFVADQLLQYGDVNLMTVYDLSATDLIVPLAYIGSPDVSKAKGFTIKLFQSIISSLQAKYPDKNLVLMPAEIGGCNALTPFTLAGALSLPVLDADLIGRAFPKVSMCKPAVTLPEQNIDVYLGNHAGECIIFKAENACSIEAEARQYVKEWGGSASIAVFIFTGAVYQDYVIEGSLSRAMSLGEQLQNYHVDPTIFYQKSLGHSLGKGTISHLTMQSGNGFLTGSVSIDTDKQLLQILFKNEFYAVYNNNVLQAVTPEIIVLLDVMTGMPIASESLQVGMQVDICTLPAPAFWLSAQAAPSVAFNQFAGEVR